MAKSRNARQSERRREHHAAKKRGSRSKLNKQTLMSMAAVGFVVIALLLVLGIKSIQLKEKNASYEKTKKELEAQIALEKDRAKEIDAYSDYVNSDEYIEKIARERLGLVGNNEIIFYSGDEKNGGAVDPTAEPDWDYDAGDEDGDYTEEDDGYSEEGDYTEEDDGYSEDEDNYSEDNENTGE